MSRYILPLYTRLYSQVVDGSLQVLSFAPESGLVVGDYIELQETEHSKPTGNYCIIKVEELFVDDKESRTTYTVQLIVKKD